MSVETLKAKEAIVDLYAEKAEKAKSFVIVNYHGLSVAEDTAMRNELRQANVEYKVVKNRLVLRALNKAGYTGFDEILQGPTAVAISYDDAVAPAKIIKDSIKKTNEKIAFKGGIVEGKVMTIEELSTVANIPLKPVLIGQFLGMLQNPIRSLAVALSEIAKKQEA